MRLSKLLATAAFFSALLGLFLGASRVSGLPPPRPAPMGAEAAAGEKVRLGSSPPSCYRKCDGCSPCTAVQVPTMPGPPGPALLLAWRAGGGADRPLVASSNYKPLGWKCRCGDRLYHP